MAWAGRHSGPHGSGAELEEFRGWRAFLHLARELQLARLAQFVVPYRRRATLAVTAMIVFTATSLSVPYLVAKAIDSGVRKNNLHVVTVIIVVFLAVNVVNVLAGYLQTYFVSWVGERMLLDLRRSLFAHIQKLSLDFFSRQKTGWIVSRLTNDIDAIDQLVTDGVTSLVTNLLTLVGAVIFLLVLDWRLALGTLAIMPVLLAGTLVFRTKSARSYAKVRNRIGDVSAHLQESISGVRVIKSFRREDADYVILDRLNAEYRDANWETVLQSGLYFPFVEFLSGAAVIVVLWYGGSLVTHQALLIGVLVAFIGYLNMFFDPVQQLSQLYNTFQSSMAAVRKIYTVLDTEADLKDAPDAQPLPDVRGDLEFRHVTFSYDKAKDVVHDVSFRVPPGGTVALVGPTGAGKSTLTKLLARFYDPTGGAVLIDGRDLRQVTTKSLREQMAIVPQEAFLFSGSIIDNIRFGRPEAGADEVRRVARIVGAHDFIEAQQDGYDTDVKEGGSGLSTGQRQLISFARALLADPRILILDEATSSVDAESEQRLERAMRVLFSGRTSIIVAHRLSTVRDADEILVIDDGRVVERGRHEQLMAAEGRYWQLYEQWERTGEAL
jgi:ABC-type multidrug transport system fused ATPase/permease subunit